MSFTVHSMGASRDWQKHGKKFKKLADAVAYLLDRGARQNGWMFLKNFRVFEIRENGSPVGAKRINGVKDHDIEARNPQTA